MFYPRLHVLTHHEHTQRSHTRRSGALGPFARVHLQYARMQLRQQPGARLAVNVVQLEFIHAHIVELVVQDILEEPIFESGHLRVDHVMRVVVDAQRAEGIVLRYSTQINTKSMETQWKIKHYADKIDGETYRAVVHALAGGDLLRGFEVLNRVVLEQKVVTPRHLRARRVVLRLPATRCQRTLPKAEQS